MPIYNGIEFLKESYESIKNQTFENWELLIGINGHEQNSNVYKDSLQITKLDNRVKVFDFFKIRSKSKTLNELLKLSTNNIICLLDVDDKWHPQKLELQIKYIKFFDVVGTNTEYFIGKDGTPGLPLGVVQNYKFYENNPIVNSSSMFYKKDGFWDDNFEGIEDYDMWLRIVKNGGKFFNLEEILCYHRIHNNSSFNTKDYSDKISLLKQKYVNL